MRLIGLLIILLGTTMSLYAVRVGEAAPELKIKKWLYGSTPNFRVPKEERATSQKLTAVVCWGTWLDGPRDVTPTFASLQREFEKAGLNVVFISGEPEARVASFFTGKPAFPCAVGIDEKEQTLQNYLGTSRMFPRAFLVDPSGIIIWGGEAVDAENIIRLWFAKEFDSVKAGKLGQLYEDLEIMLRSRLDAKVEKKTDQILKLNPEDGFALRARLFYYEVSEKMPQAIEFLDQYSQKHPQNRSLYLAAFNLLSRQVPTETALVLKFAKRYQANFKTDPEALRILAENLMNSFPYLPGTLEIAAEIIPTLNQTDSAALSTSALFYYKTGRIKTALEKQRQAISLLKEAEAADAVAMLKYYESAAKLQH